MTWLKHITTLALCISIAFAGFPVQVAAPECPMAKMIQEQQAQQMDMQGMEDCDGCDDMTKQEPQKQKGCCGDVACVAQCASTSTANPTFSDTQATSFSPASDTEHFYDSDHMLTSAHRDSQERPPKSFA